MASAGAPYEVLHNVSIVLVSLWYMSKVLEFWGLLQKKPSKKKGKFLMYNPVTQCQKPLIHRQYCWGLCDGIEVGFC